MPLDEQLQIIEDLIDIDEAAGVVKRSKPSIYSMVSRGQIPCHKDQKGRLFFRRSELLQWMFPVPPTATKQAQTCP